MEEVMETEKTLDTGGVLTAADVVHLAAIVAAAHRGNRVAWEDSAVGDVVWGTARSIGDERGAHLGDADDIRDSFLRVTTKAGLERFLPIRAFVELLRDGLASLDYLPLEDRVTPAVPAEPEHVGR